MTIPTTIPTGGHPADREMTELQKAVIALLGGFSSDILKVANGGTGLGATGASDTILRSDGSAPAWFLNPMLGANTTAGQSIPNNTVTIVVYGTVERDTDSGYNSGTGRYTIPTGKGGDYLITASIAYGVQVINTPSVNINKNATGMKTGSILTLSANGTLTVTAILNLAAGDIIDIRAIQQSGGPLSLSTSAPSNYFALKRLG